MALKRFPLEEYATLELNQVAFPKTGMVVSQTPLGDAFTKDAPCENGMWVVADKAAKVINAPAAATDKPIGIVYTAEKEYDIFLQTLNIPSIFVTLFVFHLDISGKALSD